MIDVAIAENQVMFREMLAGIIDAFGDFRVIYQARDGAELIEKVGQSGPPQILILDLEMPVMNGYETTLWFQENYPDTKILILTAFGSDIVMIRLLRRGVRGFLKKDSHPQELKEAMLYVLKNDSYYLNNESTAQILKYFENGRQIDNSLLDEREILFVKLACTEESTQHIADKMGVSVRTVHHIQCEVLTKLGVESRIKLVAYAFNSGILNL